MSDGPDAGDAAIEQSPKYMASRRALEERVAAGDYGTPADEFFDELQSAALDEGIADLDAGRDTDGPEFLRRFRAGWPAADEEPSDSESAGPATSVP